MEILKRAKQNAGEIVPFNTDIKQLKEEINNRSSKAGLTTRYGEPPGRTKIMANGCGPSRLNIWPRDKNGNLIN